MTENVLAILSAARVERLHTVPHVLPYPVGLHVHRMLVIADYVYNGNTPPEVSRAILHHDMAEYITGDVPHGAKRDYPQLDAVLTKIEVEIHREHDTEVLIGAHDYQVISCIDMLEFLYFTVEEVAHRHIAYAHEVADRTMHQRLKDLPETGVKARLKALYDSIKSQANHFG